MASAQIRTGSSGLHIYKRLHIYVSAMPALGLEWRPLGIVSDLSGPDVIELQRILSQETFDTVEGAERRALELCKGWIDEQQE